MKHVKNKNVITGIGPVSSIGSDKASLWDSIKEKKNGLVIEEKHLCGFDLPAFPLFKLKNFTLKQDKFENSLIKELKTWKRGSQFVDLSLFLETIRLAVEDSKIQIGDGKKIGIVLTHEHPGAEEFYEKIFKSVFDIDFTKGKQTKKEIFNNLYSTFSRDAYDLQTFMYLFHVSKIFNIHGYSLFINNGCASGVYALEVADQILKEGDLDAVIISGVDCPGIFRCQWLSENNLYSQDGKIRPFDKGRNGFVAGQGGAALVLEKFDSAKKRNAEIYAEYIGGSFFLESWKVSFPNIIENFYAQAMKKALEKSGTESSEIDLISAHGVATLIGDQFEARAIQEAFIENPDVFVTAFKPYVGHLLGGSALIETAILLIAMQNNLIPPILNYEQKDSKIKLKIPKNFVGKELDAVMKISWGFGGFVGSSIFKKV